MKNVLSVPEPDQTATESFWLRRRRLHQARRHDQTIYRWLVGVLLAILLEGAVRKWLLPPSLAPIAYFAKDVVIGLFLLTVRPVRQPRWAHHLEQYALGIGVCLAFSFLDGLFQFPIGAVVIFKNAVLWPLFAIRMASVINLEIARRLWNCFITVAIGMAILAAAQYLSPSDSLLNRYAWGSDKWDLGAVTAGNFVRATGTFSFITGLSTFSLVLFCLSIGRLVSQPRLQGLVSASIGLGSAILCGLTSGSRAVEASMTVILLITLLFVSKEQTGRLILMLCTLSIFVGILWNSSFAAGVLERWNGTADDELQSRALGQDLGQPIAESLLHHPLGIGLGLYSGFSSYSGKQEQLDLPYNESIRGRIATEAGVPAFAALIITIFLLIQAGEFIWRRGIQLRSRAIPFGAGIMIAVTLCLWYDHTSTGLWWWATGFILGDCMNLPQATARKGSKAPNPSPKAVGATA